MSDISDLLTKNQTLCLISDRLSAENAILRAERDMAIEERDRMREALRPFADEFSLYKTDFPDHFYISDLGFTFGQLRAARDAIEGVTEPPR